jgi:hypothetical protein
VSHPAVIAAVEVEPETFLAVVAASAVAGTVSALVTGGGLLLPAVVVELLLGVVIGPQVLGLDVSQFIEFFSDLGLGMLFFFAGYEIDLRRIAGRPLRLAAFGGAISLALAYTIGGILAAAGIVLSLLYTGSAMATTAIGAAALSRRPRPAWPRGARVLQLHPAAVGARDHGAGPGQRRHARIDGGRADRRRRALDARLPDPGPAPARRGAVEATVTVEVPGRPSVTPSG